jgi:hypothetical protein
MKNVVLFSLIFISNLSLAQKVIGGVVFPDKVSVGGSSLVLNGGGVREKYFMDLYSCGLYIKQKSSDANKIIDNSENMAIHIQIVSSLVTREKFIETVNEGFSKASHGSVTADQKSTFMGFFSDPFKKGDKIQLEYVSGTGLKVYKNGSYKGVIASSAFKKALFSIWLGNNPASADLKNKMLGKG